AAQDARRGGVFARPHRERVFARGAAHGSDSDARDRRAASFVFVVSPLSVRVGANERCARRRSARRSILKRFAAIDEGGAAPAQSSFSTQKVERSPWSKFDVDFLATDDNLAGFNPCPVRQHTALVGLPWL